MYFGFGSYVSLIVFIISIVCGLFSLLSWIDAWTSIDGIRNEPLVNAYNPTLFDRSWKQVSSSTIMMIFFFFCAVISFFMMFVLKKKKAITE